MSHNQQFPKKSTFLERFSRVYDYPYGSTYMSSYLYEPGREISEHQVFERVIQGERDMRPFHVQCSITKKKICFCTKSRPSQLQQQALGTGEKPSFHSTAYRKMAYNLQLYYDGYQDDLLERVHEKMKFERERLLNSTNKHNIDTFEQFIHYTEEDELNGANRRATDNVSNRQAENKAKNEQNQQDLEKKRIAKQAEKAKSEQKKLEKDQQNRNIINSGAGVDDLQNCQRCRTEANLHKQTNVLECNVCFKRYHDSCHDPQLNAALVYKSRQSRPTFPWQCQDCKVCNVCQLANQEDMIIICEMCDIAVHIHCLDPPLQKVPSTSWYCNDCIQCLSCNKKLNPVNKYEQAKWNEWSASHDPNSKKRLCGPCHALFQNGNYCSICLKASPEDCDESFVGCDKCDKWVHAICDGIGQNEFAQMQQSDKQYMCPACRNQSQQPKKNEKEFKHN